MKLTLNFASSTVLNLLTCNIQSYWLVFQQVYCTKSVNFQEEFVSHNKKEESLEQYNTMLFKMKFKSENMCNDEKMGN